MRTFGPQTDRPILTGEIVPSLNLPSHVLSEAESSRIDAVRGFLCVYVLFFHWYSTYVQPAKLDWPWADRLLGKGYVAVQIFFVLCGFLICHSYARLGIDGHRRVWSRFFIKRIFRLYPAWFVALIIYASHRGAFDVGEFLWNYFLLFGLKPFKFEDLIAAHSWSLYAEETFYIAFPLIILFLKRGWIFIGLLGFWLLSALYATISDVPAGSLFSSPHSTFPYFAGGMFAYWQWPTIRAFKINRTLFIISLLCLIVPSQPFDDAAVPLSDDT